MAKTLTVKAIDAMIPGDARREVPDGLARGLYLVQQPSGAKSWAFRYRSPRTGRSAKLTIGPYPTYSLADARLAAREARVAIDRGGDPGADKATARFKLANRDDTVSVALDAFIRDHIECNNKPRTIHEHKRVIEADIRPIWKDRKIGDIKKSDVIALVNRVKARAPGAANNLLAVIKKFLNWCAGNDIIEASPATSIPRPTPPKRREHMLDDRELRWLLEAVSRRETPFDAPHELMLFTLQRRNEVGGMSWGEVQLEGDAPTWTIPSKRTKNGMPMLVPLNDGAWRILNELRQTTQSIAPKDLVFTTTGTTPMSGWSSAKKKLDQRMRAVAFDEARKDGHADPKSVGPRKWVVHDFRRNGFTILQRLRVAPHVADLLLNHKQPGASGASRNYNLYDYFEEKADAMRLWNDYLDHVWTGAPYPDVKPMRGARGTGAIPTKRHQVPFGPEGHA